MPCWLFHYAALLLAGITSTSSKNLTFRITYMYIYPLPPREKSPTARGLLSLVKSNKAHSRLMQFVLRYGGEKMQVDQSDNWKPHSVQPQETLKSKIKQTLDVYQFLFHTMLWAVHLHGRGETCPAEPVSLWTTNRWFDMASTVTRTTSMEAHCMVWAEVLWVNILKVGTTNIFNTSQKQIGSTYGVKCGFKHIDVYVPSWHEFKNSWAV